MSASNGPPGPPARSVLSAGEKVEVALLYAAIGIVTLLGFAVLYLISTRYDAAATGGHQAIYFGALGIAAYVFGLRHGVDADHIAAIDNTTRKLMQEGKRPLSVGTWFSLGHSTIVVGLIVALVFATRFIKDRLPALQAVGSVAGTLVSGVFLCVIGLINIVIVVEIYRIFRGLRDGNLDEEGLEEQLSRRGFMNRYFGKLFRLIETPRQIYPVGLLFGLGFDTASEIALIAITVGVGITSSIPIYVVLVLPLLFTSGMVLVDTTDAIAMRFAYGWAFLKPIRKIYYNLTVTVISVLVAFVIGGIELLAVLSQELGLTGGLWSAVAVVNFEEIGYLVVALFVGAWAVSAAYYRYKRYDEISFGPAVPPAPHP